MVRIGKTFAATLVLAASVFVMLSGGCGNKPGNSDFGQNGSGIDPNADTDSGSGGGGSSGSSTGGGSSGDNGFFVGTGEGGPADCPSTAPLSCYVNKACSNGAHTTLTGKVYDPAGKIPLYNVIVFVPNDKSTLPVITPGTKTCSSCDVPVGDYVTVTTTDKTGSFTLQDVPTGKNVPLVVQIGKWRRIITVPVIADCKTTTLPASGAGQARLPRNHHEGDMPQMALLTGGLDDLGCFLTRVGIDAAEYTAPQGGGRLDIYQGLGNGLGGIPGLPGAGGMTGPGLSNGTAGNCTTTSCPLWASKASFENYDIVLLACEGDTFDPDANGDAGMGAFGRAGVANVTKAGKQFMHDWLNEGGKVFATHFHYTWFQNGPPDFQKVANWLGSSIGSGMCNCSIDTSFPKGQVFHDWLGAVGALSGNAVALQGVAKSVAAINPPTSRWIYDNTDSETKYMSFNTPIGGLKVAADPDSGAGEQTVYCGKAVFSDLHAGGAPSGDVPGSCNKTTALSSQEKALEFLFFDLASCVQDDSKPVVIPPPPK